MDVEDLRFAALDLDRTPASRDYIRNIASSRYFLEQPVIRDSTDLEQRMRSGELTLAIEIPPGFGRDLKRGRRTDVGVWVDGAMPFRAETIRGYVHGMHYDYLGVPLKGSLPTLTLAAQLYVTATTGVGLLISAFTRTQIVALAGTAVVTLMVATNFSGLTHPVTSLEGAGAVVGRLFPTSSFLTVSRGAFTKALGFAELSGYLIALAAFIPVLTTLSLLFLRRQDR